MRNNDGSGIFAVFMMLVFFVIAALIMDASTPKCIHPGCESDQAEGSSYCYLHKRYGSSSYKSKSSSYSSGSSSSKSSSSSTQSSGKSNSSNTKSSTSYSNPYSSYDQGYEDVYDDDDYDWDRYLSDDDYADGVDDAMDELDW